MRIRDWIAGFMSLAFKFLLLLLLIGFFLGFSMAFKTIVFSQAKNQPGAAELSRSATAYLAEGKKESALIAAEKERFSHEQRAVFLNDLLPSSHDFTKLNAPKGHSLLRLVVWGGEKPHVGSVTLPLNARYAAFHLSISPWERMNENHSLAFEIVGDGHTLYSARVSPGMATRKLKIDVRGVQTLTIRAHSSNKSSYANPGVILEDAFFD